MVSKATGPRLCDKIHGSLAYLKLSSASRYQVLHKILHSRLSLVLKKNSGNKGKWFGGRCTSQDRATGGRRPGAVTYQLSEFWVVRWPSCTSIPTSVKWDPYLKDFVWMKHSTLSPKPVSFCEGTWGEDSHTSDLLRAVLSGDTRLLGRKGEGAEQELKFPANIQPPPDPMGSSRAKLYLKQLPELRQRH